MGESELLKRLQMDASKRGARVFRNNVGLGWVGKAVVIKQPRTVSLSPGDVVIRNARPLRAGLCTGSSDLIGFYPIRVTENHIGTRLAVFTAIECKFGKGKTTRVQDDFLHTVRVSGGIGITAYDVADLDLLDEFSGVRGESN